MRVLPAPVEMPGNAGDASRLRRELPGELGPQKVALEQASADYIGHCLRGQPMQRQDDRPTLCVEGATNHGSRRVRVRALPRGQEPLTGPQATEARRGRSRRLRDLGDLARRAVMHRELHDVAGQCIEASRGLGRADEPPPGPRDELGELARHEHGRAAHPTPTVPPMPIGTGRLVRVEPRGKAGRADKKVHVRPPGAVRFYDRRPSVAGARPALGRFPCAERAQKITSHPRQRGESSSSVSPSGPGVDRVAIDGQHEEHPPITRPRIDRLLKPRECDVRFVLPAEGTAPGIAQVGDAGLELRVRARPRPDRPPPRSHAGAFADVGRKYRRRGVPPRHSPGLDLPAEPGSRPAVGQPPPGPRRAELRPALGGLRPLVTGRRGSGVTPALILVSTRRPTLRGGR